MPANMIYNPQPRVWASRQSPRSPAYPQDTPSRPPGLGLAPGRVSSSLGGSQKSSHSQRRWWIYQREKKIPAKIASYISASMTAKVGAGKPPIKQKGPNDQPDQAAARVSRWAAKQIELQLAAESFHLYHSWAFARRPPPTLGATGENICFTARPLPRCPANPSAFQPITSPRSLSRIRRICFVSSVG